MLIPINCILNVSCRNQILKISGFFFFQHEHNFSILPVNPTTMQPQWSHNEDVNENHFFFLSFLS